MIELTAGELSLGLVPEIGGSLPSSAAAASI
jgi:hypothetical protein